MKARKLLTGLLLSTILAAGVGVFAGLENNKSATTSAESTMLSGTRVYIEDQTGSSWTSDGRDAIMHVYNVSFVSGGGHHNLSLRGVTDQV